VLTREFDPQDALHKIEAHGVTHTCGVPTMMSRLADELRIGNYALRLLLITPRPCGIHMCANGACCSPTTTATRTLIRRSVSCANPANPTFGFRR
jgi:acyl-CoA synthetase (AMP-forming)/AMP-acid ligase II